MSAFISRKQSLLILLAGLAAAVLAALLLHYLLGGPRLGPVYDFFLERRPGPPVSREIVLIDTDELVEGGDLFTVLMTLSELDAASLVVEVPVLGSASGRIAGDEEIRRRFNDEYALLGSNIRNLFEAIRVGSVSPSESGAYVENLVELAERGRDRLTAALIRQDEAGSAQAARAFPVFGAALEATDLRSRHEAGGPWYSWPRPDRDGKLRRIAPLFTAPPLAAVERAGAADSAPGTGGDEAAAAAENSAPGTDAAAVIEHIVFRNLKPRWAEFGIEYAEQGPVLRLGHGGGEETRIALDRDGNILIEKPRAEESFRRLELARFREYAEADRAMAQLLRDSEAAGVYSQTRPERIPLILRDYAAGLEEELLETPDSQKRAAWAAARAEYLDSLEELLYGPAEMILVGGFEEIIAAEELKDEGLAKLQSLRDELIRAFVALREQHRQFTEIRKLLSETLAGSVCIMGPVSAGENGPVVSSALLANALLTGSHITPGQSRYILFWSLAAAWAALLCVHSLRPALILPLGLSAAFICAAVFGWSFTISGCWIDPLIPAGACLAGTLVIFGSRLGIIRREARRFRAAYGPAVSKPCLQELIRAGRPPLSAIALVPAAVIAVKHTLLHSRENSETPVQAAQAAAEFRREIALAFKEAGAVILPFEGDTALACFGSPPERIWLERSGAAPPDADNPAARAGAFITGFSGRAPGHWYFGLDWGDCAFSWSEASGYTANGRPVIRARRFAALAARYRVRAVISGAVREKLGQPAQEPLAAGADIYELSIPAATEPAAAS